MNSNDQRHGLWSSLRNGAIVRLALFPLTAVSSLGQAYLVINQFDPAFYAAFALLASLFAMIPFADLGLGAAVLNATSDSNGSASAKRDLINVLRRVLRMLSAVALTIAATALLVGALGLWPTILGDAMEQVPDVNATVSAYFAIFAISLPFSVGHRLLIGTGRNSLSLLLAATATTSSALLVTVGAIWEAMPKSLTLLAPALGLLTANILAGAFGLRCAGIPWRALAGPEVAGNSVVRLRTTALPMLVIMTAVPLSLQSDRLVLSHFSTNLSVAQYSTVYQLYLPLYSSVSAVLISLWPSLRKLDPSKLRQTWIRLVFVMSTIGVIGGCGLIIFGPIVVHVVSGGLIQPPMSLLYAVAALLLVQLAHYPTAMLLTQPRELQKQAWFCTLLLFLSVPLSIWWAGSLGAGGPVLASAAAMLICQFAPSFWIALRRTQNSYTPTILDQPAVS